MMVEYNHDSGADVYRMWHPDPNRVHQSRDIILLKKMYNEMIK